MKQSRKSAKKFAQLIHEFPFIKQILFEQSLCAESVEGIVVKRGDVNLLEVTPSAWAHDLGEWGNDEGFRRFWIVDADSNVVRLEETWCRCVVPHGVEKIETAKPVGEQILALGCQALYVVEVHQPSRDTSSSFDETPPFVVIYKVDRIDWESYRRQKAP